MTLTPRVLAWRERGADVEFRGRRIHVHTRPGQGPLVVLLHGFPSSSYDWRRLLELETEMATLAFDFLGFGLSDKPRQHTYSLLWQADLVEALIGRYAEDRPVFVLAHDMGTSVATELLSRDLEGRLGAGLGGVLLFNGSIVLERASLTSAQRLLRGPLGSLAARLSTERYFRHQFGRLFSAQHPLDADEAADQWALITAGGGHRIGHRLIRYLDERVRHADRWHGAIRDWDGPLSLAWGMRDPVATTSVLDALRELRPGVPVTELPELGHYPQIEAPERIATALREATGASL